jgi:hypothetical protein
MPTRRAATGCYKNLLPIQNFNDDDRLMVLNSDNAPSFDWAAAWTKTPASQTAK